MAIKDISQISHDECTGCCSCMNACPKKCISMVTDDTGFLYPIVATENCNQCGICLIKCPIHTPILSSNTSDPEIYAAWSLNPDTRYNSTSGGIFSEMAAYVLSQHGFVVGARYTEKFSVEHYIISDKAELQQLRQSKYVQSTIGLIFKQIFEKLSSKNPVLFCGTPCQIAGLKAYLGKEYDNLILIDFICRGVNSPKAYQKYLEMLEVKYKSQIKKVWFKNKTYGWNRFSTQIEFGNGKIYRKDRYTDLFMRGYLEFNLFMRLSCHNCKFKGLPRLSDISLADFWGVGKSDSKLDENKGTSMVILHSEKGKALFSEIQPQIFSQLSDMDTGLKGNRCLVTPPPMNRYRGDFLQSLDNIPFDKCLKKYVSYQKYYLPPLRNRIMRVISIVKIK